MAGESELLKLRPATGRRASNSPRSNRRNINKN